MLNGFFGKFLNFVFPALTSPLSTDLNKDFSKSHLSNNEEILKKYEQISSDKLLLADLSKRGILEIPVNLFIFENYYKQVTQYYYHEKYFYNDKIFVFDKRKKYDLDNLRYRNSKFWLNNLLSSKRYTYHSKDYSSDHAFQEHIDWVDGNSDESSKLSEILHLDFDNKNIESFSPHRKKIFLKYDFPHSQRVNLYSNYSVKNSLSSKLNFFKEINYGKLKKFPKNWDKVFISNSLENKEFKPSCDILRNSPVKNIRNSDIELEGYDAVCDGFYLKDFFKNKTKYSTSFVSYKEKKPNYWSTEYYFYNLGNYSSNIAYSDDLNSNLSPKSFWNINYDNLFSVEKVFLLNNTKIPKLKINLDFSKIKNIENFLKISSAFDFSLTFLVDGENRKITFNLEDIFSGKEFELKGTTDKSLFSDFLLKVQKNQKFFSDVELIENDENSFKYSVNIDAFERKNLIFERLFFEEPKDKNIFPFEFENLENTIKCFFLVGKKDSKVPVRNSILEKLKLRIKSDSYKGTVNIKYFDFLENIEKEAEILNLLTFFDFSEEKIFESKEEAKNFLKNKYISKTNNFFWENIDFVPENFNSFNDINTFKFKFLFKNYEISNIWNNFFKNIKINIKNNKNLSLIPLFKNFTKSVNEYDYQTIKNELFSFPTWLNESSLSIENYLFNFFTKKSKQELVVSVKLSSNSNPEYNGSKEYTFKKYFSASNPKVEKDLKTLSLKEEKVLDYKNTKEEQNVTKYGFIILISVLGGSSVVLIFMEVFKFFKRKK